MSAERLLQIKIAVVDDHPVIRDGVASMIEGQPDMLLVGEAGTGQDAITLVDAKAPDILLLDLRLPDLSGVQVIEQLRVSGASTRIIVLTTYEGDVQATRSLKAGASGYLLKATLRRDLRKCIREVHAGGRFVQREVAEQLAQHTADAVLTQREIDVLRLVARGCSNKLTADRLAITEQTVKAHVTSLLAKLNASDRTHAVTIALQRGFIEL